MDQTLIVLRDLQFYLSVRSSDSESDKLESELELAVID